MVYIETKKDLLTVTSEYVIAHNVDAGETVMGAGVALALCRKFPTLRSACQNFADESGHKVGETYRYVEGNRVVYNMYTKPHVWCNAYKGMTYEEYLANQEKCLIALKKHMIKNNEWFLAIPKVGSGLDRCHWEDIRKIIQKVFDPTEIHILVCYI